MTETLSVAEVKKDIAQVAPKTGLAWELLIVAVSVLMGFLLIETQAVPRLLSLASEARILTSFLAGMFFASVFTTIPATIALGEIAQEYSLFWTAFFGGLGALVADFVIFRFFRDDVSDALIALFKGSARTRLARIFHLRLFRWLTPFLGAIIIASPLPDELGLVIWGFSKLPTKYFVPLSFTLNAMGILVIGLVARSLM